MGQAFAIPTTLDYKEYTDDDNRFTIEYPDDWILGEGHPDALAAFNDQYDWRTDFQVFWNDDDTLDNRSDSKVLRAMEKGQWELCRDETFAEGIRKCSDFKAVDSDVFYTNDNRKVYFVKTNFTMEFSDYLRGQEHSFVKIFGLIYDGKGSWALVAESYEQVFDNHYDGIIYMMKSFSLESQSQPTPEPTPTPTVSNTPTQEVAIPAWTKNIFLWYGEDKVSDDELINALKFLIEGKILSVPTDSPSDSKTIPNNPLYSTYTNEKYDLTLQYPVDWSLSQLGQANEETVELAHIWYDGGMSRTQFKEVGPVDIWISLDHYFSETRVETYYGSPGVIILEWKQWCNSKNFWADEFICRDLSIDVKTITKDGKKQYHILSDYTFEYENGSTREQKDFNARITNIDSSFEVSVVTLAEDWEIYKDDIYSIIDSIQTTSTNTISDENGFLRLSSNVYELPQRGATGSFAYSSNIDLFGQFSEKVVGSVAIKITKPDGKIVQESIRMTRDGISFNHQYLIKSDFPIGEYQITVNTTSDIQLGPISFTAIPANPENQICGGAGWENLKILGGDIPASGFCRTINTPVLEKQVEDKEIPAWSKNIFLWYGQGQVSEDEIVNALQFLINKDIISIEKEKQASIEKEKQATAPLVFNQEPASEPTVSDKEIQKLTDEYWDCSISDPGPSSTCLAYDENKYTIGGIEELTDISWYNVVCDTDCNLSLYEHHDVDVKLKKFQDENLHKQLFDIYVSITPKQILDEVVFLYITTDDYAGNEAASVGRDGVNPLKFYLSIDPLDMAPSAGPIDEMYHKATMIHENAHILSLGSSQADNDGIPDDLYEEPYTELRKMVQEKEATCAPNYYNDVPGCMNGNSYLNLFFQKFSADISPSFKWYYEFDDNDKFLDHNALFYKKYQYKFVTEYAASNPDEDFAESFVAFVLKEKPTKSTTVDQKIRFFYDFPELVEMRDFIRSNL